MFFPFNFWLEGILFLSTLAAFSAQMGRSRVSSLLWAWKMAIKIGQVCWSRHIEDALLGLAPKESKRHFYIFPPPFASPIPLPPYHFMTNTQTKIIYFYN